MIEKNTELVDSSINNEPKAVASDLEDMGQPSILIRAFMFLEDKEWEKAKEYFEKVLDIKPNCSDAYFGLLLIDLKLSGEKMLENYGEVFFENKNYIKALEFATEERKVIIKGYAQSANDRFYKHKKELEEHRKEFSAWREEKKDTIKYVSRMVDLSNKGIIGIKSDGTVVATGYDKKMMCQDWKNIIAVASYKDNIYGLKSDGTVVTTDDKSSVSKWKHVVSIKAGFCMLGLKSNGSILATDYGKNFKSWKNIASIFMGKESVVGIKSNGCVMATKKYRRSYDMRKRTDEKYFFSNYNTSSWENIIDVAIGNYYASGMDSYWVEWIMGLKSDGTIVTDGDKYHKKYDVTNWENIVSVVACKDYTVGLKSDGTVISTEVNNKISNWQGIVKISDWQDIVEITPTCNGMIGLKSDGTVVAESRFNYSEIEEIRSWQDIIAIKAIDKCILGIKSDGTLLSTGKYEISDWKLFESIDELEEIIKQRKKEADSKRIEFEREEEIEREKKAAAKKSTEKINAPIDLRQMILRELREEVAKADALIESLEETIGANNFTKRTLSSGIIAEIARNACDSRANTAREKIEYVKKQSRWARKMLEKYDSRKKRS